MFANPEINSKAKHLYWVEGPRLHRPVNFEEKNPGS
jgi:hypothetical protein